MRMAANDTDTAQSLWQALLLQSDTILGVMLACAAGLLTISGALVVYSKRLAFLWEPRSLVVALGIGTGAVLCFTLADLLPAAQIALEEVIHSLNADVAPKSESEQGSDPLIPGYAALLLAGAFTMGVIMVWVMDTLCMFCAVPTKILRVSRDPLASNQSTTSSTFHTRSPTRTTIATINTSRRGQHAFALPSTMSGQDHASTKELLYKTGTARVVAFAVQNVPLGMALCIATDQNKTLGVLFACAIALLNFTQGMALAGLLTQASGFRWRAVLWCVLVGLALPLGGLLSWALMLQTELDSLAIGVFYGVTSGILVGVSLTQILSVCYKLKSAHSESSPVTTSVLGGVVLLASIRMMIAFLYA